jgi:hypothetical protein
VDWCENTKNGQVQITNKDDSYVYLGNNFPHNDYGHCIIYIVYFMSNIIANFVTLHCTAYTTYNIQQIGTATLYMFTYMYDNMLSYIIMLYPGNKCYVMVAKIYIFLIYLASRDN